MSWFSEITTWAESLDGKWDEAKTNGKSFDEFAYGVMQGHTFHLQFNIENELKDILQASQYPEQFFPGSSFGDPPITLHISKDRSFFLDMYIWNQTHTTIHEHLFEGAFTVLSGLSLESVYNFHQEEAIGGSFWGTLEKTKLLILKPGDTRQIFFKEKLIHRVLHLASPTVSLILRTNRTNHDQTQYNYNFNQLASPGVMLGKTHGKLRALAWYLDQGHVPTFSMIENLLPHAEVWRLLSNHSQAQHLLKKVSFIKRNVSLYNEIILLKYFTLILQSLTQIEDKILFIAREFHGTEWTHWVEKNYQITPEVARAKLSKALGSLPWISQDSEILNLVNTFFNPDI